MTMDQQLAVSEEQSSASLSPETGKEVSVEESNNNVSRIETTNSTSNGNQRPIDDHEETHNVYDVLGSNDQELARHRYLDDEFDQDDEQCPKAGSKKQKLGSNSTKIKQEEGALEDADSDDEDEDEHHHHHHQVLNGQNNNADNEDDDKSASTSNGQSNGNSEEQRRQHTSQNSSQSPIGAEPEQMRKLFIGGLDYKTSEATLRQHFEKFGDVIDCVVMREPQSKRSRGFGFVIYASSSMVDRAQEARPHEVDGREVQPKRAISREDSGKPEAKTTVKKVYLGGLSDDIEEPELRDYFKDFGNIVNVNIVAHKDTGKRRGFAFVEFDDYDPVDKIVLKKFHTIKDKRIEAKKAIPKVEMDARKRGSDPRAALAGAMIALSGGPLDGPGGRAPRSGGRNGGSGCGLWGDGPYNGTGSYPPGYSGQASLNGYPPHYHSPPAHYGASNWMLHEGGSGGQGVGGNQGGAYGFRHGYGGGGRNGYGGEGPNQGVNWSMDYGGGGGFPAAQGGTGPMRLGYQHRWEPYGSGYGAPRGRGYNPRS